jgi:hypothetical protein
MQMSREDQELRLSDTVPTTEEYWTIRMGTSGVTPVLSAIEYVPYTLYMFIFRMLSRSVK